LARNLSLGRAYYSSVKPHPNSTMRFWALLAILAAMAALGCISWCQTTATPSTRPAATAPATNISTTRRMRTLGAATHPTTQEVARRKALAELMRQSFVCFKDKNFDKAQKVLDEALQLDPVEPTNLYNMACLKALTYHPEDALDYLERAVGAGFTDFLQIEQDADLKSLRDLERFKALMARKEEFQRQDAQRALDVLRTEFGDGYLYEIDYADKLVFATTTDKTTLEAFKNELLRQARSQWQQLFEHKPDQFIIVVVPSRADFRQIVTMRGVEGFYNHAAHMLIADGLGFVTTHEFTHALHFADLEPLGQEHPIWLTEGLAVLFERSEYEGNILVPRDNFRLSRLQAIARLNGLVPLHRLLSMDSNHFMGGDPMLDYAESGSVIHYLYDRKLLRKFYDAFKAGYDKDKTGKLAIETVAGKPLDEFEKDWKSWMLKRTPPPASNGPNGPFLGVEFDQANDGIGVKRVVPGGPAAKAGILAGDVIVGLGDTDVRDMLSFVPLLSEHMVGETVILKVRRDHDYLDLSVKLAKRSDLANPAPTSRPARPSTHAATAPATRPTSSPA